MSDANKHDYSPESLKVLDGMKPAVKRPEAEISDTEERNEMSEHKGSDAGRVETMDELLGDARKLLREYKLDFSVLLLQRRFRIGYARAKSLYDACTRANSNRTPEGKGREQ